MSLQFSGATKQLLQYIKESVGISLDEIKLSFPIYSPQKVGHHMASHDLYISL